jgi:NEDD4-binding protein 2
MLAVDCMYAADDYFYDSDGVYHFNPSHLGRAHDECLIKTKDAMRVGHERVAVHNTFTMEKELNPYMSLAEYYGYRVVSLIVENRHGGTSVHNVPEEALDRMARRFVVKLR